MCLYIQCLLHFYIQVDQYDGGASPPAKMTKKYVPCRRNFKSTIAIQPRCSTCIKAPPIDAAGEPRRGRLEHGRGCFGILFAWNTPLHSWAKPGPCIQPMAEGSGHQCFGEELMAHSRGLTPVRSSRQVGVCLCSDNCTRPDRHPCGHETFIEMLDAVNWINRYINKINQHDGCMSILIACILMLV